LGQDDVTVEKARKIIGKRKIIGLSTHSVSEAHEAAKREVDYISVGPVFTTPTKPGYRPIGLRLLNILATKTKIPFVAIGGIDESNLEAVLASGAKRIAVVRAILSSKDPFLAAKNLVRKIKNDSIRTCKTK